MIIRIDDVSANTDMEELDDLLDAVRDTLHPTKIILAVNPISQSNDEGSVYLGVPFKAQPSEFFYNVDAMINLMEIPVEDDIVVASHGLLHIDHTRYDSKTQELSIVSSCSLLDTDTFVPPFNRYNYTTEEVCRKHGIKLIRSTDGWKSLDYHAKVEDSFDPTHKLWYMHPWRWTPDEFRHTINSKVGGFVPSHNGHRTRLTKTGDLL